MYSKSKLLKGENAGAGSDIIGRAYIFEIADVISGWDRESDNITMLSDLVFKPGAFIQEIEFTKPSLENTSKSDGDIDAKGIIQGCKFSHPGNTKEVRECRSHYVNKDVGMIYVHCDSNTPDDVYGTPCAPLGMQFEASETKDGNSTVFTFESQNKSKYDVAQYHGTKTLDSANVVPADATDIDVAAGEGQYQLDDNTVATAIADISNPIEGGVYTLLGGGGAEPSSIAAAGLFLLDTGNPWVGLEGAQITFKAFKDGAATWKFIEQSRS